VKKLNHEVEAVRFKMRNAVIEVRGLCEECA
jgi:Fe2+ or Zn2+ uptake regulation protein